MQRIRDYRVLIPKERQKDSKSQWWGMRGGSGGGVESGRSWECMIRADCQNEG